MKAGEHQTIWLDQLTPDEQAIYHTIGTLEGLKDQPLTLEIFASTAIEEFEYQDRNVYIELEVPAGYKGALYIAPIAHKKYRYQNELLFHRNLWYKILSVKFENGIYYMKARVLVDD